MSVVVVAARSGRRSCISHRNRGFLHHARSDGYPKSERSLHSVQARRDWELPRKGGHEGTKVDRQRRDSGVLHMGARGTSATILHREIGRRDPPGPSDSKELDHLASPWAWRLCMSRPTEDKSTSGAARDRCEGGSYRSVLPRTPGRPRVPERGFPPRCSFS